MKSEKRILIESHKTYYLFVAGNFDTVPKKAVEQLYRKNVKMVFIERNKSLYNYLQDNIPFDAVVIDIDFCSLCLVSKITQVLKNSTCSPAVVMTSSFRTTAMALAMQKGVDEFLVKPLETQHIIALL